MTASNHQVSNKMEQWFNVLLKPFNLRLELSFSRERNTDELMELWRQQGIHYGYPTCCTEAFIHRYRNGIDWSRKGYTEDKSFIGTGFIPCESCAKNKSPNELLTFIQSHRKERLPFPQDGG